MEEFKIGDWVAAIKAGIWQIYRIDRFKCIDPMTEKLGDKTLVFAKRFVNDSWKRSFTQDVFSPGLIFKFESEDLDTLKEFISENKEVYKKFQDFKPKPIDSIYSRRIKVPEDKSSAEIADIIPRNVKFTQLDIVKVVDDLGYDTKSYPQWRIQFISKGTELKDGFVQYEFNQVLEF